MFDKIWDFFIDSLQIYFMPLVCSYFTLTSNIFINVAADDANGLECVANTILAPVHYVLVGQRAYLDEEDTIQLINRFSYKDYFWLKTGTSILAFIPSVMIGSGLKGLSFISKETRSRHLQIAKAQSSTKTRSLKHEYERMGIQTYIDEEPFISKKLARGKNSGIIMEKELIAFRDIIKALNHADILWWLDCGTCLGAYRYEGVIPWDWDIDIALISNDFINVKNALNQLDSKKYLVQDWSSRDFPMSLIKVFIRETNSIIDLYFFSIDEKKREIHWIFSLENNIFFPDWWKTRERVFKTPIAFEKVFPLKRAKLDGIDVFMPNDTQTYLQRYYGENLSPAKIYNPVTKAYEKDLSHPYWQRAYAH